MSGDEGESKPLGLSAEDVEQWSKELDSEQQRQSGVTPENLSIKDKLLGRMAKGSFTIAVDDGDGGSFNIRLRKHIPDKMLNDIVQNYQSLMMGKVLGKDESGELEDKLAAFLDFVTLDKELDREFWASGRDYSTDVATAIITAVVQAQRTSAEQIAGFRKE